MKYEYSIPTNVIYNNDDEYIEFDKPLEMRICLSDGSFVERLVTLVGPKGVAYPEFACREYCGSKYCSVGFTYIECNGKRYTPANRYNDPGLVKWAKQLERFDIEIIDGENDCLEI